MCSEISAPKIPKCILFDMDGTILSAHGPSLEVWIAAVASEFATEISSIDVGEAGKLFHFSVIDSGLILYVIVIGVCVCRMLGG